jgi:hypothetical protein
MHASLLNEDLMQPEKLEMGISHRTSGRTGHIDWGRHEITPGWSAIRKESRLLPADRYKSASRQEIKHSRDARLSGAICQPGGITSGLPVTPGLRSPCSSLFTEWAISHHLLSSSM